MSANSINQKLKALPPKGKKVKRFLEKSDALSLAASIAEDIEKKSTVRSEKQQKIQVDQPKTERKPFSNSKIKLKEAKAALRAKHLEAKKEKSKSRKFRFKETNSSQDSAPPVSDKAPRKRVSFA